MGFVQFTVFWIVFRGTLNLAEPNQLSNASLQVPSSLSEPKVSLKQAFASTAEANELSKASRRAEETPKPSLAAGRIARKI